MLVRVHKERRQKLLSEYTKYGLVDEIAELEKRIEELEAFAAHAYRHAWSGPLREYASTVLGFDNKETQNG